VYRLCPACSDPLSVTGVCGSCGFGLKAGRKRAATSPDGDRWAIMASEARRAVLALPSGPDTLTEQQWYNVCKFWPFVAEHCRRARPEVGPSHPLDATARRGPLTRFVVDAEADVERAAMQGATL
jgi:hypothetical protein